MYTYHTLDVIGGIAVRNYIYAYICTYTYEYIYSFGSSNCIQFVPNGNRERSRASNGRSNSGCRGLPGPNGIAHCAEQVGVYKPAVGLPSQDPPGGIALRHRENYSFGGLYVNSKKDSNEKDSTNMPPAGAPIVSAYFCLAFPFCLHHMLRPFTEGVPVACVPHCSMCRICVHPDRDIGT